MILDWLDYYWGSGGRVIQEEKAIKLEFHHNCLALGVDALPGSLCKVSIIYTTSEYT